MKNWANFDLTQNLNRRFFSEKKVAVGRVVRDTAATTTTAADSWENAWNSANVTFTQFHDSFLNLVGVKSDQELMDKAKAKFNEFETDLSTQFNKLSEEVSYNFGANMLIIQPWKGLKCH